MSIGSIGSLDVLKSVMSNVSDGMTDTNDAGRNKQLMAEFENQMKMAQSIFGEGSHEYGEGSSSNSLDISMINDSMMIDALTTINQIMRPDATLQREVTQHSGTAPVKTQAAEMTGRVTPHVPGDLSAQFESGSGGISTIGYDRVGGTSYGKYQIASKPGTMDRFLSYLDKNAPEWADKLRSAGPANTGSKQGNMPTQWKNIAAENPTKFEKMQHDFIASETYDPARSMILQRTGLDLNSAPPALREVLWSTSVQHGATGAARIFGRVIDQYAKTGQKENFNASLIEGVYDSRKGQFGSSTTRVQEAVSSRMDTEKQLALSMLSQPNLSRIV